MKQAKANRVLSREHAGHSKHSFPTIQEMTVHINITRWSIPKSDYVLCSWRWRSSVQSAKIRPGADCGSDHKCLITKFRLKFKIVRKATRPSRYDLNQIPYDYTMKVTNRFKRLDMIECLRNYGRRFMILWHCTGGSDQDHPKKNNSKKAKWLSEEALQISEKRQRRKGKIYLSWCRAPKNSKER